MPTLSLHDVSLETYDAIDVLELHGPKHVWKSIWVGDLQIVFHPGEWRHLPLEVPSER